MYFEIVYSSKFICKVLLKVHMKVLVLN